VRFIWKDAVLLQSNLEWQAMRENARSASQQTPERR